MERRKSMMRGMRWAVDVRAAVIPLAALLLASVPAAAQVRAGTIVRQCVECDSAQLASHRAALASELARIRAELPRLERQVAQAQDPGARRELVARLQALQRRDVRLQLELEEAEGRRRGTAAQSARIHVFAPRGYIGLNVEGTYESRNTPTGWSTTRYADFPEVVSVEPGSPAERAGVRAGDVLLAVNGVDAKSPEFTRQLTAALRPGNELVMRFRRGGGVHTVTARVEQRPPHFYEFAIVDGVPIGEGVRVHVATPGTPRGAAVGSGRTVVAAPPTPQASPAPPAGPVAAAPAPAPVVIGRAAVPGLVPAPVAVSTRPYPLAGAELLAVNVELARKLGADRPGLWVLDVGPQTPASRSGLRIGDLIVRLPATDVASIEQLQLALQRTDGRRGVELGVLRDGEPVTVVLRW